jgi:heterodisulfide reductase subunit C
MAEAIIMQKGKKTPFLDKVKEMVPNGDSLSLCLTCGACVSGCPAAGMENMDSRKFIRMVALGMDEEITKHPWVWLCSMCTRCTYVCPMPQLPCANS